MIFKNLSEIHILYLCYFGLREPLVQTQVLPYLREINKLDNVKLSLLTFEPNLRESWSNEQIAQMRRKLEDEGITWYCLPYHKYPSVPATLYDVLAGVRFVCQMIRNKSVSVVHARVHVPALIGALAKRLMNPKVKLIFDVRGFMPEEYTDCGHWKSNGLLYKSVKRVERWLFSESDAFVVLTEKARQLLFPESKLTGFDKHSRPIEVIPCCVDIPRFGSTDEASRKEYRQKLKLTERKVIVYTGSLGTWYLADEMADFLAAARKKDKSTFALILTQSSPEIMNRLLRARGFTDADFLITRVSPADVPLYLNAADLVISFIRSCYSKQSSSPTKIAEYLICGLPVVCNPGVGDVDEFIKTDRVGAIIDDFSENSYLKVLEDIEQLIAEGNLAQRCKTSALLRFDLEKVGGVRYRNLYSKLGIINQ